MLEDRNDVFRSSFFEEMRPSGWIEVLGPEHGDEILVAKLSRRSVSAEVVLAFVRALPVHICADTIRFRRQALNTRPNG